MILDLTYWDNPILRANCQSVEKITDEIKQLVQDMIETMDAKNGVGLAAPQIGKDLRIFVIREPIENPDDTISLGEPQVFINPNLTNPSKDLEIMTEGCLSFPGLHLDIIRPLSITVEAMDLDGKNFKQDLVGYKARVIMHENDHINGKLFIDRVNPKLRKKIEPDLKKIKAQYSTV